MSKTGIRLREKNNLANREGRQRKNEELFKIDSYEKAMTIIWAMRLMKEREGTIAGLHFLFKKHPEIRQCTHAYIADLVGLARETVTRLYKHTWVDPVFGDEPNLIEEI